jgi:dTDP-4-amino-4,6-dideoxy-D-galactose acyltransferase
MRTITPHSQATLQSLPWDSQHFGFPVASLDGPELGDAELLEWLHAARRGHVKLVYWAAAPGRVVSQPLLDEFGGLLVDRKITFQVDLRALGSDVRAVAACRITKHSRGEPSPAVVRLAVAAGVYSRFRLDPRIPRLSFERLYENWIVRSVHGELADMVLIAGRDSSAGDPAGLITISVNEGQGSIGLIAVDESARGRGIGRSLIHAAHRWLLRRQAQRVTVVTQLENVAACRLYESCGYQHADLRDRYHFWP